MTLVPVTSRRSRMLVSFAYAALAWLAVAGDGLYVGKRGSCAAEPTLDFNRDIRPILAEHCLQCHGPDQAEAGLNLSQRETSLAQLDSGASAIVPGKPGESELLKRVRAGNPEERMPPGDERRPLSDVEIQVLERWIKEGAAWREHWAFRPLLKPAPPPVRNTAWARNPIDAFVLGPLEVAGLGPAPEADRVTLARRLAFDLLGLPPSPEEVDDFVRDDAPDAYERLVDRYLQSPRFGERWGRHWLDLARFADSDGYEKDKARPDAFVYRDWVIEAMNDDLPFDRFTIEQIAGDLLPDVGPSQRIATAFQRQTLTNEEGGVDQEEYRVAAVFDRTETVGAVWLGLTVGCARCHSHKYDPLSHSEYYRLFAFFNGADEVSLSLPVRATDLDAFLRESAPLQTAIDERRRELAPLQQQWEAEQRARLESTPREPLTAVPLISVAATSSPGRQLVGQPDGSFVASRLPDTAPFVETESKPGSQPSGDPSKAPTVASDAVVLDTLDFEPPARPLTGVRLETLPDERLPGQGPGLAPNGNFVLNRLELFVVDAAGAVARRVSLSSATADYEQKGYSATAVLADSLKPKTGWAVGGQTGLAHQLDVRTAEPLRLEEGQRLRVVLTQAHGKGHLLGKLRLRALVGDERSLLFPANIAAALEMYPEKRVAAIQQTLFDYFASRDSMLTKLREQLERLRQSYQVDVRPVRTLAQSLRTRPTHRFHRGEFLQPQEEVLPGTPAVLPPLASSEFAVEGKRTADRLELARWLVSPDHPLTPRVAANRVWMHLFGEGIVRTPGDFGMRGEPPTHPELLDWLAATFRDDLSWSTKGLIKTIVMSATYRQSSAPAASVTAASDPGNRLLGRQGRFRVEGEIVRDLTLRAAGLLTSRIGGPSVFPSMPADLAKLSFANNFNWTESRGEDRYRRGLYTFFKRTIPHPTLMMFDCPDANVTCVRRSTSNTPLQALTMLNNEAFVESARELAATTLANSAADSERIEVAFHRCLSRRPNPGEVTRLEQLLAAARVYYAAHPEEARQIAGDTRYPNVATDEHAAWATMVRALLNLDEFVTRE